MIPRLHRRGTSFKGALGYVLHDPGKESSERVAWVDAQNIYSDPQDAWFEMFETYRNRTILKRNAGVELRGRDNKAPVLHYTLSWHASDNPDLEHMRAMAFDSLKALGLSEHEAVMACHSDKEHHHVHVVVNTVHPYTGKTAPLKFSKLEFSKWAEAYEKEHGIHCEQRIKNNERRREISKLRGAEREQAALALLTGKEPPEPAPFVPVNDNSPNRRRWLERKDIVGKMKALHAELDREHKHERGETWERHKKERRQLEDRTIEKLDAAHETFRGSFKGRWNALYRAQWEERDRIKTVATHPFERAVFVFTHRDRLGVRGKPLSWKSSLALILSRRKLRSRIEQLQIRERKAVARDEKAMAKEISQRHWQMHRAEFHALRDKQATERAAERAHHTIERKDITFARAKGELIREEDELAAGVPEAPPPPERPRAKERPKEEEKPKEGVPLTPKVPKRDTKALLMPGHVAGRVPLAPKNEISTKEANALLTGKQELPDGIPRVPETPPPKAPDPARSSGEAKPGKKEIPTREAKTFLAGMRQLSEGIPRVPEVPPPRAPGPAKSFGDAAKSGKAEAKKAFKDAADPKQPQKPSRDEARKIRMRKDMEKWKRRGARDDFDRER